MKTSSHGNDKGYILATALLLLFSITLILYAGFSYVHASFTTSEKQKEQVLAELEIYNMQVENIYDTY